MTLPDEPGAFDSLDPARLPTRDLLLAQALDVAIRAERQTPGSSRTVIARQPAWARAELTRLVNLAGSLDAIATNAVMSDDFRVAARARLMRRIGAVTLQPAPLPRPAPVRLAPPAAAAVRPIRFRRKSTLALPAVAVLLAALLAAVATLTVSANALPGEPLYSVKQVSEELSWRLAIDPSAQTVALLSSADTRLDEVRRLMQQGRTDAAAQTTRSFDQTIERATASYGAAVDESNPDQPVVVRIDDRLSQEQRRLEGLLPSAPQPAQAELRDAIQVTERGRQLISETRSDEPGQVQEGSVVATDPPSVTAQEATGGQVADDAETQRFAAGRTAHPTTDAAVDPQTGGEDPQASHEDTFDARPTFARATGSESDRSPGDVEGRRGPRAGFQPDGAGPASAVASTAAVTERPAQVPTTDVQAQPRENNVARANGGPAPTSAMARDGDDNSGGDGSPQQKPVPLVLNPGAGPVAPAAARASSAHGGPPVTANDSHGEDSSSANDSTEDSGITGAAVVRPVQTALAVAQAGAASADAGSSNAHPDSGVARGANAGQPVSPPAKVPPTPLPTPTPPPQQRRVTNDGARNNVVDSSRGGGRSGGGGSDRGGGGD
jgi:hypothetical protein